MLLEIQAKVLQLQFYDYYYYHFNLAASALPPLFPDLKCQYVLVPVTFFFTLAQ